MSDFSALVNERVVVTTTDGETIEGLLEAASDLGVVVKPKHSAKSTLLEADEVSSIEKAEASAKKLKPRSLPQVNEGKYRLHLIDRHGYTIEQIEAMSEEKAQEFHESINHEGLGHFHREAPAFEETVEASDED